MMMLYWNSIPCEQRNTVIHHYEIIYIPDYDPQYINQINIPSSQKDFYEEHLIELVPRTYYSITIRATSGPLIGPTAKLHATTRTTQRMYLVLYIKNDNWVTQIMGKVMAINSMCLVIYNCTALACIFVQILVFVFLPAISAPVTLISNQ